MKKIIFASMAAFALLAITSCEGFKLQTDYRYTSQPLDPHVNMTAWEFMQSRADLSEMVDAVKYAEMEDFYSQTENVVTYLFINNDGMATFRENHAQVQKIEYCDKEQVKRLLRYHMILGEYHSMNQKLPVEPIYVKTFLEGEWGLMTIKVNKSSSNSIGSPIANGNIVCNETSSNFRSKRISSVTSNILPTNGVIHIFNDYAMYRKTSTDVTPY